MITAQIILMMVLVILLVGAVRLAEGFIGKVARPGNFANLPVDKFWGILK